jgi:hypothetical protein
MSGPLATGEQDSPRTATNPDMNEPRINQLH